MCFVLLLLDRLPAASEFCKMNSPVLIAFLLTVIGGLLSGAAGEWIDCGGQRVSSKYNRCCDGVPHPITPETQELCCGKDTFHIYSELCCDGVIYPKYANVYCCGTETYNYRVRMCCGTALYDKDPAASCCGNNLFYDNRQKCRDGKLVDF
ncbi:hypothetical protein LSAT2_005915 [Lamellibrachia satsuma]|nr:hypothetical protein LSAT2_005915 [Lamellibrachia satsuma]